MSTAEERAAERSAWALKRIAYVLEAMSRGVHRGEHPCQRCGSYLQAPAGTCAVCELPEDLALPLAEHEQP